VGRYLYAAPSSWCCLFIVSRSLHHLREAAAAILRDGPPARRRRRSRSRTPAARRSGQAGVGPVRRASPRLVRGRGVPVRERLTLLRQLHPREAGSRAGCRSHHAGFGLPLICVDGIRSASFQRSAQLLPAAPHVRCDHRVSLPVFWLGQLLLYVSGSAWDMPSSGLEIGAASGSSCRGVHPAWITVAVGVRRVLRAHGPGNMIGHERRLIRTARARPSERRVTFKHGLRGALTAGRHHAGTRSATVIGGHFITNLVRPPGDRSASPSVDRPATTSRWDGVTVSARCSRDREPLRRRRVAFLDPRVRYR